MFVTMFYCRFYMGNSNGFLSSVVSLQDLENIKKDTITTRELSNLLTVRNKGR